MTANNTKWIDGYRIKYRSARKAAMGHIIRECITGSDIELVVIDCGTNNSIDSIDKFVEMTIQDLKIIHAGSIVGLGITEAEFELWKAKS